LVQVKESNDATSYGTTRILTLINLILVQQEIQKKKNSHKVKYTRIFSKMSKVSFLENELNTYSVVEVQLKKHQFYLIKMTKNRKIFDMNLQIKLGLQQSRFLWVILGFHSSSLESCQIWLISFIRRYFLTVLGSCIWTALGFSSKYL